MHTTLSLCLDISVCLSVRSALAHCLFELSSCFLVSSGFVTLRSGKDSQKAELAAAEARGKADAEKSALQGVLNAAVAKAEAEQATLHAAVQRLEHDAKDYKVGLHLSC